MKRCFQSWYVWKLSEITTETVEDWKVDINTTRSDVDLLVEFDQRPNGSYADRYFGLLEDLSALLHRPVDLVIERAAAQLQRFIAGKTEEQYLADAILCSAVDRVEIRGARGTIDFVH